MKTLVVVSTCARPGGTVYLWDTLDALGPLPEGVRGVVLSDGVLPGAYDHVRAVARDGRLALVELEGKDRGWEFEVGDGDRRGSRRNMWRALKLFATSDADQLLFLEDDCLPCWRAVERACNLKVPERSAFLSLYDGSAVDEGAPHGLHHRSVLGPARTGFWGTVALVFPRWTAEWCLKRDPVADSPRWAGQPCGGDADLGSLLAGSPWTEYAVHVPCLFDHRGEVSAAHESLNVPGQTSLVPGRVSRNFLGRFGDACALPPVGEPGFPDHERLSLAVVLATYNRFELLQKAVTSVRATLYGRWAEIIVVDGGSTDGSREWLAAQPDVVLVGDRGPLDGAVRAFNLGFRTAIERGHEFVGQLNDDAECADLFMWERAVAQLRADPGAGAVAFKFDLRGKMQHEFVHGKVYVNFGVMRASAMEQVSLSQVGSRRDGYWNPIYRTYGADCEACCWMWRLGWRVLTSDAGVHDVSCADGLRRGNTVGQTDSALFWRRWTDPRCLHPTADAPLPPSGTETSVNDTARIK